MNQGHAKYTTYFTFPSITAKMYHDARANNRESPAFYVVTKVGQK